MFLLIACIFLASCGENASGESGYGLMFPAKGVSDYANILGMPSLKQFTICFWMWSDDSSPGTPFSYAKGEVVDELVLYNYGNFELKINGTTTGQTNVSANDGKWHQVCVTWKSLNGEWKLFIDGKVNESGTDFQKGHTIERGGSMVLGQEQDAYSGGFNASQSFQGMLAHFNVWSNVLPEYQIKKMSKCCGTDQYEKGDVYKWSDFTLAIRGNPRVVMPSPCACF